MKLRKDTVSIRYVLETVCEDFFEGDRQTITLSDRIDFVMKNLSYISYEDSLITFNRAKKTSQKDFFDIPFYNYLLVYFNNVMEQVSDNCYEVKEKIRKIKGFDSFSELKDYIHTEDVSYFSIYVRCINNYRKAFHSFYYKSPGGYINYVNQESYCFMYDDYREFGRYPNTEFYFDIHGLCEIYMKDEIICLFANSLEDIYDRVFNMGYEIGQVVKSYYDKGFFVFDNNTYIYEFKIGNKGFESFCICNENGTPYCYEKHGFCGLPEECCNEFNCQPDIDVF